MHGTESVDDDIIGQRKPVTEQGTHSAREMALLCERNTSCDIAILMLGTGGQSRRGRCRFGYLRVWWRLDVNRDAQATVTSGVAARQV